MMRWPEYTTVGRCVAMSPCDRVVLLRRIADELLLVDWLGAR